MPLYTVTPTLLSEPEHFFHYKMYLFSNFSVKTFKISFLQIGPSQNFQKGKTMSEHVVTSLPGESFEECF